MGQSSDGILVYGIDLGESGKDDLEELHPEFFDDSDEFTHPTLDLVLHCSFEYMMWILAAKDTEQTASRGYPTIIKITDIPEFVTDEIRMLAVEVFKHSDDRDAREDEDITEPAWLLCSLFG